LLVEGARTNLVVQSEVFNTSWTLGNASISSNAATAPDGTLTADALVENDAVSTHNVYQSVAVTQGQVYTWSVFGKKVDNRDWLIINADDFGGVFTSFDLANGMLGTVGAGVTARIIPYDNGWYRCCATKTKNAAGDTLLQIFIADADDTISYDGDNASSIYLWGGEIELGSFPSSYVKTVAASVERTADVAYTLTGAWFNEPEGTVVVRFRTGLDLVSAYVLSLNDGTANEEIRLLVDASGNLDLDVIDGGVAQAALTAGAATADTHYQAALGWKSGKFFLSVNGGALQTDSAGTVPTPTRLDLGSSQVAAEYLHGHVEEVRLWNRLLHEEQIRLLSNLQ